MDEITNIIDTVEDVADKFSSQIGSTEKRLLDEVLNLVKELNVTNGRINSSVENLKILSTIKTKLKQAVLNKEYLQGVKDLIKGIDRIMNVQTSYFNKAFTVGKYFKAKSELAKHLAVDDTVEMLAGAGMEANVTSRINEMLLRSITSGGKYADLVRDMSDFLTTNENGDGALSKYAQTWVNTSLSRFAGQNNKLMTDDLGLEWFMYVGSNKDTTREFCEHLVKKKYVHKSEIPDIVNGLIDGHQCEIYERTGLPKGMIDGTTADNFQANCGGWNCGHQLVQVNKVAVPKDIRDRIEGGVIKELKTYNGSLQDFANDVFNSKKANNTVKKIGKIDDSIIEDMLSKNIKISSDDIFISDKKILKYLKHPKDKKGAVIDKNRWNEVEKAIQHPTAIYEDLKSKSLVYVYASPYELGRSLKVIIHPNYVMDGNKINLLKSIGVVDDKQLTNAPQYFRKIK